MLRRLTRAIGRDLGDPKRTPLRLRLSRPRPTFGSLPPAMGKGQTTTPAPARLPPEAAAQKPVRETLALEKLVTDAGTQVRAEISDYIVTEYADALREGARFPPVVVFRANGADLLADGFHRVRAYQRAERDEIEADVYEGGPDEALWFALGANRAHGQRLSEGDKRRAIEVAYKAWPDVSQRRIAAHVGCAQQYVGRVREQLTTRCQLPDRVVGRDGRRRPATRSPKTRARARAETAPPPTAATVRSEGGTGSPEPPAPQTTDDGLIESTATGSEAPGPVPADPRRQAQPNAESADEARETSTAGLVPETETDPEIAGRAPADPPRAAEPHAEATGEAAGKSRGGVTARQAARKRSNRIVSVVVDNALNLTAQEDLVDFSALDHTQLPQWIEDLKKARRLLLGWIHRLEAAGQ